MSKPRVLILIVYTPKMLQNRDEIGTASIGAFLRQHGYDVTIMGIPENTINYEKIVEYKPDVIGMPIYRDSVYIVYDVCRKLHEELPQAKLCLGGVYATNYATEIMEEMPLVDYIVRGEGEEIFLNLLKQLEDSGDMGQVRGLTYRRGTEIISNDAARLIPDLNCLPFPSRDMLTDNKLNIAVISTSRGCTGKCSFCECPRYWRDDGKQLWRGRSIRNLVDEIEQVNKEHGIQFFDIVNATFEDPGSDYESVREFADELNKRKLNISYELAMRTNFHREATDDLIESLRQSGLGGVFFGVESANKQDLKLFKKMGTIEDSKKSIDLFRRHNIRVNIGFISIHPYTTIEALRDDIEFLRDYGYAAYFHMLKRLRVDKGTDIFSKVERDGLLIGGRIPDYGYAYRMSDKKAGQLADFLENYFVADKETSNIIDLVLFYERSTIPHLNYTERVLDCDEHRDAHNYVVMALKQIQYAFAYLNEHNSRWFSCLLDLAEDSWNDAEAYRITDRYLSRQLLRNMIAGLNTIRNKFYKNILSLDEKYEYYVI